MADKLDVSKLVFKKQYAEAGLIQIRIKRNKFAPITKENLIKSVELGYFQYPLHQFFTLESIEAAKAKESEKPKKSRKKDGQDSEEVS